MSAKKDFNVAAIVNNDGCFDLQFRKDTRHERTNSPTYYRWKTQFVVTGPKENAKVLEKIKNEMGCGEVSISKDQARFSVQKISDIAEVVVPFFRKNCLAEKKKKEAEEARRNALTGEIRSFLDQLLSLNNPGAQRIAGYVVDPVSGNITIESMAVTAIGSRPETHRTMVTPNSTNA